MLSVRVEELQLVALNPFPHVSIFRWQVRTPSQGRGIGSISQQPLQPAGCEQGIGPRVTPSHSSQPIEQPLENQ